MISEMTIHQREGVLFLLDLSSCLIGFTDCFGSQNMTVFLFGLCSFTEGRYLSLSSSHAAIFDDV